MASSKTIKGITIEIEGKTSSLVKSLDEVNKNLRVTQDNLKTVNKALKLDPSNFEALKQKQDLLNTAIEETKEKLELEKKAAEDAAKALEEGTITQGQYDTLQAEVAKTTAELTKLESEAANVANKIKDSASTMANSFKQVGDKLKEVGNDLEEFGKKTDKVGKNVTKKATVPIVALGTGVVKTAADFESSMSQVAATMGTTTDSITELTEFAKKMGETTAFSASESAEALNYLALAGYNSEQMMETLPIILDLAAAGNVDLAYASDMVTDAMSALEMQVDDAGVMVDQMAKTASTTNTSVAQLGEAILTIGASAKTIKGGTTELNAALGILANNGIKGAEGGTHLRNVILSLQNPTDTASDTLNELGVTVYDTEGNMRSLNDILGDLNSSMNGMTSQEKTNIISNIFNKTDLASVNALLASTGSEWNNLEATIRESSGAAGEMADTQLDNLNGQIKMLKSEVEAAAISLGNELIPVIKDVVKDIKDGVTKFNSLNDSTKKTIITIAGIVAALGPLLVLIGKISTGVGAIIKVIGALSGFLGGTVIPLISGTVIPAISACIAPIAAVVLAITAVITVIKNWESISELFSIAWEAFCNFISSLSSSLKDGLISIFSGIYNGISDSLASIRDFAVNIWNNITSSVTELAGTIKSNVIDTFVNLKNGVTEKITNIKDTIVSGITTAVDFIKSLPEQALTWGKDMIQNFIDGIKAKMNELTDALKSVGNKITSFLGFSIPDEGPLSKADTWMPDMMDLLSETMLGSMGRLDGALNAVGQNVSMKMQGIDYSNQLDAISGQLAGIGGDVVIPVYIGNDKIDNLVVSATQRNNFRSGGR